MIITENEEHLITKIRWLAENARNHKLEYEAKRAELKKQFKIDWKDRITVPSERLSEAIFEWNINFNDSYFNKRTPQKLILPLYLGKYKEDWSITQYSKMTNNEFQSSLHRVFILYMENEDILVDALSN